MGTRRRGGISLCYYCHVDELHLQSCCQVLLLVVLVVLLDQEGLRLHGHDFLKCCNMDA